MQIILTPFRNGRRGYALIITMIFLAVCLLIFASMMSWTATNAKINQRNNQYNMSEAAAEAATERALAPMMRDFLNQSLNTNGNYYATNTVGQTNYDGTPWPVQYVFSDANGTNGQISVSPGQVQSVLQPLGSQYANLEGFPWLWTNIATATPIGQPYTVSATVTQVVNFSSIPIFQFAIFYNINLEIDPGALMFVNGAVWSNQGLWAGTGNLTFNSTVSAVGQANTTGTDPFATGYTDGSSTSGGANFTLSGQPTSKNTAIIMPIAGATNSNPTNVESILNIPPNTITAPYGMGTAGAYTTNGLQYFANEADLVISNSASGTNYGSLIPYGTNITIYFQDANDTPYLQPITPDFYIFKGPPFPSTGQYTNYVWPDTPSNRTTYTNRCVTNVYYAGWSFVTNVAFYDYRESDTVQAVQIDVSMFNIWVTNQVVTNGGGLHNLDCFSDKGHWIDSIWVYNNVALNNATLPAVRVVNGLQLPNSSGFTVATPMPLYVKGDYNVQTNSLHSDVGLTNTSYTYPAALMADAVTILSSNWNDAYNTSTNLSSRNPSATTVNAAMLEGIVQSSGANYSGGVENFLRYLEDWGNGNVTNTYNGSIVVMFPSVFATNYWQATGNYYNPPRRNWGFDFNFLQQSKLPPLTPQLKKTVRVSWSAQ
jgi:hypothetical protein